MMKPKVKNRQVQVRARLHIVHQAVNKVHVDYVQWFMTLHQELASSCEEGRK